MASTQFRNKANAKRSTRTETGFVASKKNGWSTADVWSEGCGRWVTGWTRLSEDAESVEAIFIHRDELYRKHLHPKSNALREASSDPSPVHVGHCQVTLPLSAPSPDCSDDSEQDPDATGPQVRLLDDHVRLLGPVIGMARSTRLCSCQGFNGFSGTPAIEAMSSLINRVRDWLDSPDGHFGGAHTQFPDMWSKVFSIYEHLLLAHGSQLMRAGLDFDRTQEFLQSSVFFVPHSRVQALQAEMLHCRRR
eukprot:TRINITY_DN26533_c0_g1_i1.p1 TRINITY_DN26533_c0_g1~~TRINITY_DN26533_c0_g1_i1.p1  ORF type:complete len:249 (-),score=36.21 TRINITY_DN26533_c0_g1_i1:111-857(-)